MGEEAKKLYHDANAMLDEFEKTQALKPIGVIGLFPANRVDDDIEIYTINDAKAGIFKDIAYSDYPHNSKNSLGGSLT